jgi:type VII secretion protein EccB
MAMQSRKDLLHAHRLMTQRAALALLRGEPDVPDQPLRRLNVGTFAGILVGVIVAGIFGIWGLLFHGAPSLQPQAGTLIRDKQTGANYVWCEHMKAICPVANYASALLELQASSVTVQTVNQSSLAAEPQGPLIGIQGLPPDLPTSGQLIRQPWSVCTQTHFGVAGATNGVKTTTVAAVGVQPGGQSIGSTGLLLVNSGPDQDWVIGNGRRMPIQPGTMADLFSSAQPVSVPSTWLNAVPQGALFAAPNIADTGAPVTGPTGAPATVGETLYQVGAGTSVQYYVIVKGGGLSPITPTQKALLAAQPGVSAPQILEPSELNGRVSSPQPPDGLPATDTNVVAPPASAPLCVVFSGSGPALSMQVETGGSMPGNGTPTNAPPGSNLVDEVALATGKGALVQETGSSTSYMLVTDGHRYALESKSVISVLGYSTSQVVQLPAGVVDLIPAGPGFFDPGQALDPVSSTSSSNG